MYDFVDRSVTGIDSNARFLLWSMRSWVKALEDRKCPPTAIGPTFARMRMIGALPHFHMAMMILNRDSLETQSFGPLHCLQVSESEAVLLSLFRWLGEGERAGVRDALFLIVDEDLVEALLTAMAAVAMHLKDAGFPNPEGMSNGVTGHE